MDTVTIPQDFKEFLQLLTSHEVEYLLVGGYAVAWYGYPRATVDFDIWIGRSRANAEKVAAAVAEFGFGVPELTSDLFLQQDKVIRMGVPPFRLEILTSVSGLAFDRAYEGRKTVLFDSPSQSTRAARPADQQEGQRPSEGPQRPSCVGQDLPRRKSTVTSLDYRGCHDPERVNALLLEHWTAAGATVAASGNGS